jgi:spore maturation protein CgeB
VYRHLLENESLRLATGRLARERVLREHTHIHRAQQLADHISSVLAGREVRRYEDRAGA